MKLYLSIPYGLRKRKWFQNGNCHTRVTTSLVHYSVIFYQVCCFRSCQNLKRYVTTPSFSLSSDSAICKSNYEILLGAHFKIQTFLVSLGKDFLHSQLRTSNSLCEKRKWRKWLSFWCERAFFAVPCVVRGPIQTLIKFAVASPNVERRRAMHRTIFSPSFEPPYFSVRHFQN